MIGLTQSSYPAFSIVPSDEDYKTLFPFLSLCKGRTRHLQPQKHGEGFLILFHIRNIRVPA